MTSRYMKSNELLERAEKVIPLGSQTFSKSRIQFPVPHSPLFLEKGKGGRVWDIDGNEYVDLICGLLPVTLGYCDPDIDAAIKDQLGKGISFSLPTVLETELAERLVELIPCAEMVRFGKNGTDATSAAVRLARAHTGKDHIIACGYHGWQDWYIGATARKLGVPEAVQKLTHKLPFNDLDILQKCFAEHKGNVAAIIMEPASSVEPREGYLQAAKDLAHENGALLIFDEVITGFRFHLGGAQSLYGVTPDLASFGKGMGNGMPISAVVGRADIMKLMNDIFYSGTFGGEALSLAASIAVIDKMKKDNVIEQLWATGQEMVDRAQDCIDDHGLQDVVSFSGVAPWKVLAFHDHPAAKKEVIKTRFMIEMLKNGVLIGGSHNICYAHNDEDIEAVAKAYSVAMERIKKELDNGVLEDNLEAAPIYPVFQVRG